MRIIDLNDDQSGLEAFLVIDHELFPVSAGGTRMLPDVDVREIARLARAMTWKFAALRVPYAGAKSGIRFDGGDRAAVLAAYKRALEPYRGVFVPGPDMGTFPADFFDDRGGPLPLLARTHDGLGMDDLATGHGIKGAAEAALAHLGRSLKGAAVAVEGFGKVGAGTARACVRAGARLVGVSTLDGLVADPEGLDVEELLALRERYGDRFVEHGSHPLRRREELFELECDLLVPGARPDSITVAVAERLSCAVIAPAANIPYGPGALEVLHRREIVAVPDFLSNAGAVYLYDIVAQDGEPAAALATIEAEVGVSVARTLIASSELGITPMEAALRDARVYLAEATGARGALLDELIPV
ncbi:MAG TPA: Glu/Leu/Phe/Val dehydrogenase dimerization domain-containing protein [Gaiellaceae bacterium]|nr:Glu/Leu/Phe/Val dehydrogenase dimerization domain-containing protein [Gaiellaceae bacterium]